MSVKVIEDSHVDHGISKEQLKYILSQLEDVTGFTIRTLSLPGGMGTVPNALYGPAVGDPPVPEDEVHYSARGDRGGKSRMVNKPMRKTSKVTVIVGPHGEDPAVLYTAFGGPLAPKEPTDPTLESDKKEESEQFWSQHALSSEG